MSVAELLKLPHAGLVEGPRVVCWEGDIVIPALPEVSKWWRSTRSLHAWGPYA